LTVKTNIFLPKFVTFSPSDYLTSNMLQTEITSLNDVEIIEKVLAGEKSLYELLMRKYNQRLFRIGLSILKNETDVEDAMQETYIKAYQHLAGFERKSSLATWLTRIMINECLQKKKLQNRFQNFDASNPVNSNLYMNMNSNDNKTPEQHLLNRELKHVLEKAILNLPENYAQVYMLREVEHLSVKETSECLQLSEVNVKVRLNRAKGILKQEITKAFHKTEIFSFHLSRCNGVVENVMSRI
jgi:RNA polymerase sigma factor (sigma-70 family)